MRYAMIMAGGSGTRLWPMSRIDRPKQLLRIFNGRSLLELAFERIEGVVPSHHRIICTGERYRPLIEPIIPDLRPEQILGEPIGRDTANAIGFTAAVLSRRDPQAVFVVLTADHLIEPRDEFQRRIETGLRLVEESRQRFVTFFLRPTYAATGFGYVERSEPIPGHEGAYRARSFVEKPELSVAQEYLRAGTFGWNSGMFVFEAKAYLEALQHYLPESYRGLMQIAEAWDGEQGRDVLDRVYPTLPVKKGAVPTSVDFAVMTPAAADARWQVCAVEMNLSWIDVGSWPSFAETVSPDEHGNRDSTRAVHLGSRNVLAVSDEPAHLITTIGCEDLMIIHTADATLVCRADQAQKVKELVDLVEASRR